jgi:hypothetical protein
MDILSDTARNLRLQIKAGALSRVESLSTLIAEIATFDHLTNVVARSVLKERI